MDNKINLEDDCKLDINKDIKKSKITNWVIISIWLLLTIFCLIYGVMVKMVGSGTGFFIVWLILAGMCACMALATYFKVWSKMPLYVKVIFIGILAIGIGIFVFVEICIYSKFDENGVIDGSNQQQSLDYIIVLGAQVRESGPSMILRQRLDKAYEYLVENENTMCILSGGKGENEPFSEAKGMRDYLLEKGIDSDRIIMEDKSLNTIENIQNTCKLVELEEKNVGIVTNNFHMFRALAIAKKQGINNIAGISANTAPKYLPNNMFREFFGVIKDVIKGNM